MRGNLRLVVLLAAAALGRHGGADAWSDAAGPPRAIHFNRDIRPLLSEACFTCHGPDPAQRKAGLRLDTREGLFDERKGRVAVQPGQLGRSEMYRRLTTSDEDDLMPPPKSGKHLTPAQVALVRRWIEDGATWEGHWAYTPPERPAVPAPPPSAPEWARNPIDRFLLARWAREGMQPAPEADRRTLIRRLHLDLTGLPPSPETVRAFERDPSASAYEQWADRLLARPEFGERLALHWLDLVRYADTDGFHADNYRSVWPYRDYVIRAFHANRPFDTFTLEQLAGDLLPHPTLEQRVASTYNRLGRTTEEGGAQPKEYLAKYAADRVRNVGLVWLGATTGCAECHDHKYDPFTTRDFYRLAAYFADVKEVGVGKPQGTAVPSPAQAAALTRLEGRLADLDRQLRTPSPALLEAQARWETATRTAAAEGRLGWQPVNPSAVSAAHGTAFTVLEDLSVLATGPNPPQDTYTVTLSAERPRLTAFRLETLTHPEFARSGLSRANGNFVLTRVEAELASPGQPPQPLKIARALADFAQDGFPIQATLDDKPDTGWAVAGHEKPADRRAVFVFATPIAGRPGAQLVVRLKHESAHLQHQIGRFRLAVLDEDQPTLDDAGLPREVLAVLDVPAADRTPAQAATLTAHFLGATPALDPVRDERAATHAAREALVNALPTTLMTVATEPRVTRVLPRGNWMDDRGEVVTPAPPEFLGGAPASEGRATRLELARWLVARDNPLTARVMVNRWWQLFFSVGLSKTLDDFGAQGEWPRHPELLDWLACEFMEPSAAADLALARGETPAPVRLPPHAWDVQHIVRLMVTSAAYRQSSTPDPAQLQRDPFNRLVARQARFRLGAELVRDYALAVSGLLVPTLGGPSVKPYQPAGYWDQLNFPKRQWERDRGDALHRRGLYTFWCRSFLQPSLLAFDACTREEGTAERPRSNTPLQALALLNDPTYVEAARAFAERILRHGGTRPPRRAVWAFQQLLARDPDPAERRTLVALAHAQLDRYRADPAAAAQLLGVGERPVPTDLEPAELAAWTALARALLNLHEPLTRD